MFHASRNCSYPQEPIKLENYLTDASPPNTPWECIVVRRLSGNSTWHGREKLAFVAWWISIFFYQLIVNEIDCFSTCLSIFLSFYFFSLSPVTDQHETVKRSMAARQIISPVSLVERRKDLNYSTLLPLRVKRRRGERWWLTWKWRMMVHIKPRVSFGFPSTMSSQRMFTSLIWGHNTTQSQHQEGNYVRWGEVRWG